MRRKLTSILLAVTIAMGGAAYSMSVAGNVAVTVSAAGSFDLWFDHSTVKTPQNSTESTGMTTYHMYMAKNEIENCQFFVAPKEDAQITAQITDFVNDADNAIKAELYFEHYISMGGTMLPDPIPPLNDENGPVSVSGGKSQGFIIKVSTGEDTPAGEYAATLTVKNGNDTVTAPVTLTVWDFVLPEETPFATAVDISRYSIYTAHNLQSGDDGELYKTYYDFMLENRVSAYSLPYDILDYNADEYMNNPRVTSFMIGGDYNGSNTDDDTIKAIYEKLSSQPTWANKGFFYYVDEPADMTKLNQIKDAGEKLASLYPGYQMISPFFMDIDVDGKDQIEFMSDYINIWCTKINAWTPTGADDEGAIHMMSDAQVQKYGDYASRMAKEVAGGDKNWVYYCWEPLAPYTTFDASHQPLEVRVALWQAMQNDVTGLLYFTATEWSGNVYRNIQKINAGGVPVYGDGVLLYPGLLYHVNGPVSSMRFENLRDGIEDYMYLSMAKDLLDEENYNQILESVTVNVLDYTDDSNTFADVRKALGNMIENGAAAELASGVIFKEDSGYAANPYTGFVSGVKSGTSVIALLSSLENMNGISVVRGDSALSFADAVTTGDKLVLTGEDGTEIASFTIIVMGDVNGDSSCNLIDVTMMLQKMASWEIDEYYEPSAADVNGDGVVNVDDVVFIMRSIADWNVNYVDVPVIPGKVEYGSTRSMFTYSFSESQGNINLKRGNVVGVKFSVGAGEYARDITANYPSWADNIGRITLSLYKWNTDYETTLKAMPIYTNTYVDFNDNAEIKFSLCDSSGKGVGEGEYLWLIHNGYQSGGGTGVGMWTQNLPAEDSGITIYYDGVLSTFAPVAIINIGVAKNK